MSLKSVDLCFQTYSSMTRTPAGVKATLFQPQSLKRKKKSQTVTWTVITVCAKSAITQVCERGKNATKRHYTKTHRCTQHFPWLIMSIPRIAQVLADNSQIWTICLGQWLTVCLDTHLNQPAAHRNWYCMWMLWRVFCITMPLHG